MPFTVATVDQTAEMLGVSTRSVRRWIDDGSLPAFRIHGHLLRIKVADIEALLEPVTS
ncbi:helix-turn-helix domain-containing protein [Nesterenkonia sp. LB17]|uniref:helix-turn-helix domain-containing protein n=1 Tax=Nesterenkonia sp. LB17 TaxID=2901230 RepID=UPI00351D5615